MIRPVLLALRSLTFFPELVKEPRERDYARAAWLYPVVGLCVGAVQVLIIRFVENIGVGAYELVALLALLAGTLVSRAGHVSGLAVSFEAWGRRDRSERPEAPQDRSIGPGATIAAVFLILLKWQLYVRALSFLGDITFPLVICCLGRWSMVVGAVKVRCADDGHSPALGGAARLRDVLIAAAAPVAVAVLLHRSMAAALLMVSIVIPVLVRLCARNRGGVTTDVAGSVNEFVEVAALALLLFQPLILPFLH